MQQRANPSGQAPVAVIVMGVSGCGKSTVGALLARELNCPFLEGDSLHHPSAIEKMKDGISLTDEDRWPWLDLIAREAASSITQSGKVVIACSALREVYRDHLRSAIPAATRFLLLDSSRDELLRRLLARADHFMPPHLLDSQLATLERPSCAESAKTLLSDVPPEALCEHAIEWLRAGVAV